MTVTAKERLLDQRYDPARDRAYHLSILSGQGLSAWAVHALDDGAPVALAWADANDALKDLELPRHPVTVSFVALPEWSTLVPDGALTPGSESAHLALVHGNLPNGALRDEPLRSLGATCLYVHDDRAEHDVLERFPHARPVAMQGLMVRTAMARWKDRPVVLIHRSAERVDVAVAGQGRLLLSNTFPARTAQDLLYFTLLAVERTGLSAADVRLLWGGTHLVSAETELLGRFFAHTGDGLDQAWAGRAVYAAERPERWMAVLAQFACVS
jgi:hypothetical protein